MSTLFQYSFFNYAIGISIVLSLLFALVSFIIVTRKLTFLAIGTEHAAFGGVGLANFLQIDQFFTTMIFCAFVTVFAGRSHSKVSDMGISMLFSGAMAFGMILLSIDGGSFNLLSFLFGDLIGVTAREFLFTTIATIVIFAIVLPNISKILFITFDRDTAEVSGVNVDFWDTIIYIILSVSIILGIKLVGVLLVAAMTVLPAAFALLWQKTTTITFIISFLFSMLVMVGGIILSFYLDIAPGALIVSLAVILYFVARLIQKLKMNI